MGNEISKVGTKQLGSKIAHKKAEETIRVSVSVLDDLMTLAGEMVLGRNQLLQFKDDRTDFGSTMQNIDMVTTELQEKVMKTRLQPINTILGKFNRIIRDLGSKLGKEIDLVIVGKDVELDRSILEAISDPLTHLIRNCCDHAIEQPAEREGLGKSRRGLVKLLARHSGGQVHVEIIDDGRGLNPEKLKQKAIEKGILSHEEVEAMSDNKAQNIIFLPGFSSAEQISDVSGRGVGMDVVKTNIEKIGGSVELVSEQGAGTRICLKLPLTLAIVPAMIVGSSERRFAIPQTSVEEIVKISNDRRIEKVRGSDVLRLRGKLLPLVTLSDALDIPGESSDERFVVVLKCDNNHFGLIVDAIHNIEEIVVKPLSRFVQDEASYSGVTILGDGSVCVILDAVGIAQTVGLNFHDHHKEENGVSIVGSSNSHEESHSLLLFRNAETQTFAINLAMVSRLEKVRASDIEKIGKDEYIQYFGNSLRLIRLHEHMPVDPPKNENEFLYVIIPDLVSQPIGIVATSVVDTVDCVVDLDEEGITGSGILGSAILNDELTIFLDVYSLYESADPEHYAYKPVNVLSNKRILLAEDTAFFRTVITQYLSEHCKSVDVAVDGAQAWDMVNKNNYDLLVTDIEMPNMNGFELTERIRSEESLQSLPIVAVTSLAADQYMQRGLDAGLDAYETKFDKEKLRITLENLISQEGNDKTRLLKSA